MRRADAATARADAAEDRAGRAEDRTAELRARLGAAEGARAEAQDALQARAKPALFDCHAHP